MIIKNIIFIQIIILFVHINIIKNVKLLVIHSNYPKYDKMGCDYRLMQIMIGAKSKGFNIDYLAIYYHHNDKNKKYRNILKKIGVNIFYHNNNNTINNINNIKIYYNIIQEKKYQSILFFLWSWPNINYSLIIKNLIQEIIHNHDTKTHRPMITILCDEILNIQIKEILSLPSKKLKCGNIHHWKILQTKYLPIEKKILNSSDLIMTITGDDKKYIRKIISKEKNIMILHYFSTTIKLFTFKKIRTFEEKKNILFIGDNNDINKFSLYYFIERIFPTIEKKMPNVKLIIIGNIIKSKNCFYNFLNNKNIQWLGYVANLEDVFSTIKATVAYIVAGTGLNTKFITSLTYGVPIVVNKIGARGLFENNKLYSSNAIQIVETSKEYVNAILKLYNNKNFWMKASIESIIHVKHHFGNKKILEDILTYQKKILDFNKEKI